MNENWLLGSARGDREMKECKYCLAVYDDGKFKVVEYVCSLCQLDE